MPAVPWYHPLAWWPGWPLWAWLHSAALGVTCLDKEGFPWWVLLFHPEMGTLSTRQLNQGYVWCLARCLWTYMLCSAAEPTDKSLCPYKMDTVYIQSICCDLEKDQRPWLFLGLDLGELQVQHCWKRPGRLSRRKSSGGWWTDADDTALWSSCKQYTGWIQPGDLLHSALQLFKIFFHAFQFVTIWPLSLLPSPQ